VLTGSARITQEAQERAAVVAQEQELSRKERTLERLRAAFEAELAALRAKFDAEQAELAIGIEENRSRASTLREDRDDVAQSRSADTAASDNGRKQRRRA
jgi:circadian clock protein KaiC